ncbi:hypothetical protein C8A01DRAFT_34762 [Parachaetomium inaequale]|uniref:Uncharacterized protein n=1 Tax=Parachaetomium inaequale TaxID=2588326 RepID=A0AAN6ST73_9PEZI|nr:hypothetical protein C8A01DRAFT_34762 [Parachaetomium inaequale]
MEDKRATRRARARPGTRQPAAAAGKRASPAAGQAGGGGPEPGGVTASKTSRAKRAERRDLVRELQEKLLRAEAECSRLALPPDQQANLTQAAHDREMKQLQDRLSQEQEERKQLQLQLDAHKEAVVATTRAALRGPFVGGPPVTSRAKSCWRRIEREIEYVSSQFFQYPVSWDSVEPAFREKLVRVAPKAQQYVEDADGYSGRFLYQAWIWRILVDTVFPPPPKDLATPENAEWTVRYHIWRNLTVGMVCHITGDETRVSPGAIVKILQDELAPVVCFQGQLTQSHLDERLGRIAKHAAEVDMCMQLDRADWAVILRHPDTGVLFGFLCDSSKRADGFAMAPGEGAHPMAAEGAFDGRPVDLIAVPMLRELGDDDGLASNLARYDHPMQVVVDRFPDDEAAADSRGDGHRISNGGTPSESRIRAGVEHEEVNYQGFHVETGF